MGRPNRVNRGGLVYHVLNRVNAGRTLFETPGDYEAFERILLDARTRVGMRILSYCLMPSHWHFVLYPRRDGDLSRFVGWLTLTHTQRLHAWRRSVGTGHVYQGRFRSMVVESDGHLTTVCRYVERNPLRSGLVRRAEEWRWGSLWRRTRGDVRAKEFLSEWPVERPRGWVRRVNLAETPAELEALRECVNRGRPFGGGSWVQRTAERFGLEAALRPRGRPQAKKVSGTFSGPQKGS